MRDAPNLNLAWTSLAAEECRRLGVRHAVVSPGSRSAPLAVAFGRHGGIEVHVAHDERGGAFMALGIAQATGIPAVCVMTSGTAVANALPACVEARMSRVPLLVFAADRPPELRDCGANQSIPQPGLLDGGVRWSVDVPCPSTEVPAEYVLSTVDEAFARATGRGGLPAGAVHVNWQFREPLAPDERPWDRAWLASVARWERGRAPWRTAREPATAVVRVDDGVVVAGLGASRSMPGAWRGTVLADAASGRADAASSGADLVLRTAADCAPLARALEATRVTVVGGGIASKRLGEWIARQRHGATAVGAGDPRQDPSHRASESVAGPARLEAGRSLRAHPGWTKAMRVATRAAAGSLAAERALSEPAAMATACAAAGGIRRGTVFLGSSMPVRDADFMAIAPPRGWTSAANRGASGIDGLVSTATGHAAASGRPVLAFVGDVSALHDLNGLQLASTVRAPLVLVVLNNDGGGIFRYLPIAAHGDVFERLFATPHGRSLAAFARGFGLAAESPRTRAALGAAVRRALRRRGATIVEVTCAREASEAARRRAAAAADAALRKAFRG
jgi:2-succinyl-5-enolpyruvyl-6-hydroxy-3-cyclohexene-1-carboxylate synthase